MAININDMKSRNNLQTLSDLGAETVVETLNLDSGHKYVQTSTGRILIVSDWRDEEGVLPVVSNFVRDVTQMYTNKNYAAGKQRPHTQEHLTGLKDTFKKSSGRLTGLTAGKTTLLNNILAVMG